MGICDKLDLPSAPEPPKQKWEIPTQLDERIRKKRAYERNAAKFRSAVWLRDRSTCRLCGKRVKRSGAQRWEEVGHVHHLRGRRVAPEDKWNLNAAVLLCNPCHLKHHSGKKTL